MQWVTVHTLSGREQTLPPVHATRSTNTKHALQDSLEGLDTPKCNHIRRQQIVDCNKPLRRPTKNAQLVNRPEFDQLLAMPTTSPPRA